MSGLHIDSVQLVPMTQEEYAAYERAMGEVIVEAGGIYWRRVRRFFYRPLVAFEPMDKVGLRGPRDARIGGWQYVVQDPGEANSSISFLMFRNIHEYTLQSRRRRRQVRSAEQIFAVRRIEEPEELISAHPVYVDFQRRTGYKYRVDRLDPYRFSEWAREVFRHPKVIVLGAWKDERIHAVEIIHLVGDTLNLGGFFATTEALRENVGSLILHAVRTLAARSPNIKQIFAGLRKHGPQASVDNFYLERGCEVVTLPARLHVHPVTGWLLRTFRPDLWRRLLGQPVEDPKPVAPAVAVKPDAEEVA